MAGGSYVRSDEPMTWNRRPVDQPMIATEASFVLLRSMTAFRRPGWTAIRSTSSVMLVTGGDFFLSFLLLLFRDLASRLRRPLFDERGCR